MLIDRKDASINLCEIKFHNNPYSIKKADYQNLLNKRATLQEAVGAQKQIFMTLISPHGLNENKYSTELVDHTLTAADLMT